MAIIYSQSWAAGNSLFTSVDHYDRSGDGTDPLYPEMEEAEGVTIASVAGSDRLDWNGTHADYMTAGIKMIGFPTFVAETGSVTFRYRPNATSLGFPLGYYPLFVALQQGSMAIGWFYDASTGNFDLHAIEWGFGGDYNDTTQPFTFAADTDYVFRVDWQCGTHDGGFTTVADDGFVRFYIDDVLITAVNDFALFMDYTSNNEMTEAWFGHSGMIGALDLIEFSSDVPPQPAIIGSTVFGSVGTVTSSRTFLANLDEVPRTIYDPGTFYIGGDLIVTGTITGSIGGGSTLSADLDALGT